MGSLIQHLHVNIGDAGMQLIAPPLAAAIYTVCTIIHTHGRSWGNHLITHAGDFLKLCIERVSDVLEYICSN